MREWSRTTGVSWDGLKERRETERDKERVVLPPAAARKSSQFDSIRLRVLQLRG
jgi:hypothetical protein